MDPLSLTASIIAVLQLTGRLLSYWNEVRNATKEQAQLAVELSNIYSLLLSLRFRVEQSNPHDSWFAAVRDLGTENGPLDQIREALEMLASKTKPSHGIKKIGKQIIWKFEKCEMGVIFDRIERIKTLVNIALTGDLFSLSQAMNQELSAIGVELSGINEVVTALHDGQQKIGEGVSDMSVGLATLNDGLQDEERRKIVNWLSPIDFRSRQQEILKGACAGTRQWLFDSEKFRNWMDADRGTLWCPGIPGAGKTVTSSIIIDHLQSRSKKGDAAVLCLFCNYRDRAAQGAELFMANLLKQVVQQKPTYSPELKDVYNERENGRPTFAVLARLFSLESSHFPKIFVLIDALDETSEHEDIRRLLLSELQSLKINLLVTSRYKKSIEERFAKAEHLEIRATATDVQTYVKARIPFENLLARHIQADPKLEEMVVNKVVEKSQGMFLMARFHMDSLVTKTKRKDVRKALEILPPELDGIYDETMERIEGQGKDYSELARRVLLWVGNTSRPLSPVELQHAVAIQPGMTELDDKDLDEQDSLVSACAGLVVMDAETHSLRFVHYTTQEYFDRKREILFGDVHAHITMSCITYLNLATFASDSSCTTTIDALEREEGLRYHPLRHYAASKWVYHASKTENAVATDMVLHFLNEPDNVFRAVRPDLRLQTWGQRLPEHFSGIQIAAMHGLRYAMQRLLDEGTLVDSRDCFGRTPLFFAAANGELDVVSLLVARDDVDINATSNAPHSMTPLVAAVSHGHHPVIKVLVQAGADISTRALRGTALDIAMRRRDATATGILLEAGANPNTLDEQGLPVAFIAATQDLTRPIKRFRTSEEIRASRSILLLLQKHGANLQARDRSQRTLLHLAAEACNYEAVEILLAEGLDPNVVDDMGQTPLQKALCCRPPLDSVRYKIRRRFHTAQSAIVHLLSESKARIDGHPPTHTELEANTMHS